MKRTPAKAPIFEGIMVPLATPFRGGKLDLGSAQSLAAELVGHGVAGLVVCGTTGEAAGMSEAEQALLLAAVIEAADARCPVIFGIAGSDTAAVSEKASRFNDSQVAGFLVSAPSYVRPSQEGLLRHFRSVAAASAHPVILYNIPARTGVAIETATVATLAADPKFAGIKECGSDLHRLTDLINAKQVGVFGGDDALMFAAFCLGANGAFSVAAHIRPDLYVRIFELVRAERIEQARALFNALLPFIRLLFSEPNPAPLKAVLALQGKLRNEVRLPMTTVSRACRGRLEAALHDVMALR